MRLRPLLLVLAGLVLVAPAFATSEKSPSMSAAADALSSMSFQPAAPSAGPVLYDQYDNQTTQFPTDITSQDFEDNLNTSDAEAADDFVVPAGVSWTIDAIDVDGEFASRDALTPVPTGYHVRFWSNNPTTGLPANMVAERLIQAYVATGSPGDLQISLNPAVPLVAGTWWVSIQARLDFGTSSQTRQWYWHHRTVQANQGAAWRNPGNYWLSGCIQFSRRATCQNSTAAPDQVFRLHGTSAPVGPPPPPTGPPPVPPPPPPPPVRCHVPDVVGRSLNRAVPIITDAHCRVGQIDRIPSSRRRRGKVVGQSPHAGRNLPRNTRVNLVVGR